MACFLAPATFVILTSTVKNKIPKKYHLDWLITMLWGGVLMLIIEHISHGEVVLYPPFLTAMKNPANIPVMLHEIATTGLAMTIAIVAVWTVMIIVERIISKKKIQIITT